MLRTILHKKAVSGVLLLQNSLVQGQAKMMQKLIALTAGTVLAVSVRIFILTHQAPAPDFGHLGELADADSQAVSLAQKGFASAKLALFAQVR